MMIFSRISRILRASHTSRILGSARIPLNSRDTFPTSRISRSTRIVTATAIAALACTHLTACSAPSEPSSSAEQSQEAAVASSSPRDLREVTFMLSWVPDTNHIGVYVAKNKGWYEEAGLDVSIVGVAQAGAEQAVNTGLADFALGPMSNIGTLALKGVDLMQVLQVQQKPSAIWCALASNTAIQRPKDLDGKIFATFGANEDYAIAQRMVQADGGTGDFDTVTVGTSTFQVLQSGQADFGGFYSTWEGVQAELEGPELRCFHAEEYGVPGNPNEIGIIAKRQTIEEEPEFVRAFVQATQRGYEYAYAYPEEAADILVTEAAQANIDPEFAKASMRFILEEEYWGDPAKIADGSFILGTPDIQGAQEYYDFIAEAGLYEDENGKKTDKAPQAGELATGEFLMH